MTWTDFALGVFDKLDEKLVIWMGEYGLWVYALLLLLVFLETNVIGSVLPGDTLVVSTGIVCAGTQMSAPAALTAIITGTILGYFFNYALGRLLGRGVFKNKSTRWLEHEKILKVRQFFRSHERASIFFARFIPFMRSLAPLTAGLVRMDIRQFGLFSVLGGFMWGSVYFTVGYYVAKFTVLSGRLWLVPFAVFLLFVPAFAVRHFFTKRHERRMKV